MDIIISNSSGDAIYEQIYKQIRQMILNGTLHAGDALPSMRKMAQELRISVITTKRAYDELEKDGFIESYTGKGSFVAVQNETLLHEENLKKIESLLSQVCEIAECSGVSLSELHEMLDIVNGGND